MDRPLFSVAPVITARQFRDSTYLSSRASSIASRVSTGTARGRQSHNKNALKEAAVKANESFAVKPRLLTLCIETQKDLPKRLGNPKNSQDVYDFDLEILAFMKRNESSNLPSIELFGIQSSITPKMRSTVIDWLVEVHNKLRMQTQTLFYAVNFIDRFLSHKELDKSKYQLLTCAALLIASKSEEIYPPSVKDLVTIAGNSFTEIGLARMESTLFSMIDFNVNPTVSSQFLRRYIYLIDADAETSMLAHYLNELMLLNPDFIGLKPSLIASSVICLTLAILRGPKIWTPYMESNTGYSLADILELANRMRDYAVSMMHSKFEASKKKYSTEHLKRVGLIEIPGDLKFI